MNFDHILQRFQNRAQQALDLAFPPRCAGCEQTGTPLCDACFALLMAKEPLPYRQEWAALQGLVSVNTFRPPLRNCIHALKYEGKVRLAEPLGILLAYTYYNYAMNADMLLSVPLHSERQKQRGYNHSHLLASVCSTLIGVPLCDDVLMRRRATPAQVGLSAFDRQHNVAGAFAFATIDAARQVCGRRVLLIDDVCTTGSTLNECAAVLFQAQAASVWGLVLASSVV